jgi:hypothetical protein
VEYVVAWGLEHRHLEAIQAIGVDEIQYAKGHKYLTLVYQIEQGCTRLLWIGKDRTVESFEQFFNLIGKPLSDRIQFVCSDMWKPYFTREDAQAADSGSRTALWHIQGSATRARMCSAYFSRTEQPPPRGFGSLDPSSRLCCTHLMAELILISNKSAASRRDVPASTVPLFRLLAHAGHLNTIVVSFGSPRPINADRLAHFNNLGNPPVPLDSDSAESAVTTSWAAPVFAISAG